jgi:hypothetical protein
VFSLKGLAARLDDRFAVLTSGRRTALPRHQTLRAAIDWSYEVLPETEQLILRRIAVFRGDFTIDSAAAVGADDRIGTGDVFDAVANLAVPGRDVRFRAPPGQFRASPIRALGSHLGCLTAKRTLGNIKLSRLDGWPMRSPVNASPTSSRIPTHDSGPVWFARPSL